MDNMWVIGIFKGRIIGKGNMADNTMDGICLMTMKL